MANWSDLPEDILILIVKRIRILSDYIRFSGVCSSWRSVALQDRFHHPRLLPGIIVPKLYGRYGFLPVTQTKLYHDQDHHLLPPLLLSEEYICLGSCNQGWLLMVEPPPNMLMHILNPVTRASISLPPLRALSGYASKVVLSSNPNSTSTAIYACVLYNDGGAIGFCQLGDKFWTQLIPNSLYGGTLRYEDAIFFKGKLYVVVSHTRKVIVCELTTSLIRITEAASVPRQQEEFTRNFLVELGGELLYVVYVAHVSNVTRPPEFRVFKLDFTRNIWVTIESLGEYALFLGYNQAFSLSELDVRGIKRNRIYLNNNAYNETGIFNLEDSKTEPVFSTSIEGMLVKLPAIWVNPIPW